MKYIKFIYQIIKLHQYNVRRPLPTTLTSSTRAGGLRRSPLETDYVPSAKRFPQSTKAVHVLRFQLSVDGQAFTVYLILQVIHTIYFVWLILF